MKGAPLEHSPNCSCTSCTGVRPLKRNIDGGKGVDKLNLGKNIPLKERILLSKLTRVRADYDALRKELVSGSSSEKADLRVRKQKHSDGTDSSSGLLDIIDFVDRGGALGSLSECCSCCVCSSTQVEKGDRRKERRHHRHAETVSEGGEVKGKRKRKGKSDAETVTKIESAPTAEPLAEPKIKKVAEPKVKAEAESKPVAVEKQKMGSIKKALHSTATKVKSVSCTCTSKFSGFIKESKAAVKKLRKEKQKNEFEWAEEYKSDRVIRRPKELAKESYDKIEEVKHKVKKTIKTGAKKSLDKIKESKVANEVKDKARRSLEKLKDSKTKVGAKIHKSIEKVKKVKPSSPRSVTPSSKTETESFPVDREELAEFREHHKDIKDWVCKPNICVPGKCKPKKCLEILIHKKIRKRKVTKKRKDQETASSTSVTTQAGGWSTTKAGSKIKVAQQKKHKKVHKPPINITISKKQISVRPERKRSTKSMTDLSYLSEKPSKSATSISKPKKGAKPKKEGIVPKQKKSAKSITAVASDVSCYCPTPVSRPKPVKSGPEARQSRSTTAISRPQRKKKPIAPVSQSTIPTSQTVSITEKEKAPHRTKKVKPTHKAHHTTSKSTTDISRSVSSSKKARIPHKTKQVRATHKSSVSRSTTPTSEPIKFSKKAKTPHKIQKVKPTHKAHYTTSKSTTAVSRPVSLTKKARKPHIPKKAASPESKSTSASTTTSRSETAISRSRPVVSRPRGAVSRGTTSVPQSSRDMRPEPTSSRSSTQRQAVRIGSTFSFNIEFYKNKPALRRRHTDRSVQPSFSRPSSHETAVRKEPRPKPKRKPEKKVSDRSVGRKRHLKHKHSQQSASMAKPKHSTANSLRRCFCTLKLGKPNIIKEKTKPTTASTASETSRQSVKTVLSQQESFASKSVATKKKGQDLDKYRKLLPYECEPGICVPDKCDPYNCLKLINKREGQPLRRHAKRSSTLNHSRKSTSSYTTRNVAPQRTKRVQSTVFTYKTEVPARKYKEENISTTTKQSRVTKISPVSPNRQAVRIGSSFSFSIEFYKNRPSKASEVHVKHVNRQEMPRKAKVKELAPKPPKVTKKPKPPKVTKEPKPHKKLQEKSSGRSSYVNAKPRQKSISMKTVKTQKNVKIGSAIIKCLCNLKLNKAVKLKQKPKAMTTATETTSYKEEPTLATVGTKTKKKKYILQPYECEPYVCIPGECDPYECLKRMKRKGKDFGTSAEKVRKKSVSSTVFTSATSYGAGPDKAKVKVQDTSPKYRKVKNVSESISPTPISRPVETPPRQVHVVKRPASSLNRQAVRIGSSFSFNIEFYKNRRSVEREILQYPPSERMRKIKKSDHHQKKDHKKKKDLPEKRVQKHNEEHKKEHHIKKKEHPEKKKEKKKEHHEKKKEHKAKQTDTKKIAKIASRSQQQSQATTVKKSDKNIDVKPLLKRCFCTLKLQGKTKQKPTAKIYTVSRVTAGETRFTAQKHLLSYEYKHSTLAREYELHQSKDIIMGNKTYLHPDSSACTKPSSSSESNTQLQDRYLPEHYYERNSFSKESSLLFKIWNKFPERKTLVQTKQTRCFSSYITFSKESNIQTESLTSNQKELQTETPKCIQSQQKASFNFSRSLVSGISIFFKRCFNAINIQEPNIQDNVKKNKPYECESEVCLPYQCDLKQCPKLIVKRLMKHASKMTTTSVATRSKSMYAPRKRPHIISKNLQNANRRPKNTVNQQTIRHPRVVKSMPISPEKQGVHIGSCFSFDMEFSKTSSRDLLLTTQHPPPRPLREPRPKQFKEPHYDTKSIQTVKQIINKETEGKKANHHNTNSQSITTIATTATRVSPKVCLCTLDLQEKDRLDKKKVVPIKTTQSTIKKPRHEKKTIVSVQSSAVQSTMTSRSSRVNKKERIKPQTSAIGQNTKRDAVKVYRLDINECEPGVCTPGSCNPYKCLELIKQRNRKFRNKELITDKVGVKSVHSDSDRKHNKGRHVQSDTLQRKHRANAVKTKPSPVARSVSPPKKVVKKESSSRSAVRIGSKASFNIEFYKESSLSSAPPKIKKVESLPRARSQVKATKTKVRPKITGTHSTKSTKSTKSRDTRSNKQKLQVGAHNKHDQGTSAFNLKRCFCTLQLQKKGKHPVKDKPHKQLKQTRSQTKRMKPIPTAHSRSVMVKEKKKKRPQLKSYECEPKLCVPGSCDPIICLKRIQRRQQKEMSTGTKRPRSASTISSNNTRTTTRKIQPKRPKAVHAIATMKAPKVVKKVDKKVKKVPMQVTKSPVTSRSSSDRQSVRIGSSFSFSVEFSKQTSSSDKSYAKVKKIPPPIPIIKEVKARPVKTKHTKPLRTKHTRDMKSQAVAKKVRNTITEVKPLLKRCFCTLKLQNRDKHSQGSKSVVRNVSLAANRKPKHQPKPKSVVNVASTTAKIKQKPIKVIMPPKTTTKYTKARKYKGRKLEPYECEPGVCIPGQCNPYECIKRIRKRQMHTTKSGTDYKRDRSTSSRNIRTAKGGGQTKGTRHRDHNRKSQITPKPPEVKKEKYLVEKPRFRSNSSSLRQSVRISSSFSFDLEFFKETAPSLVSVKKSPEKLVAKKKKQSQPKPKKTKSQGAYVHKKHVKDRRLQRKAKADTKGTGMVPLLKRCFCTLTLQKQGNKPKTVRATPKTVQSKTVSTKTRKEKKIKVKEHQVKSETATVAVGSKKKLYVLKPYECEPFVCVPGECDPYECDERIKGRIMKDCGIGPPCMNKCATTFTTKDGTFRCIDTQCDMKKKHTTKTTLAKAPKPPKPPKHRPQGKPQKQIKREYTRSASNLHRQSVRMGSCFSFDVEFFKDSQNLLRSAPEQKIYVPKEKKIPKHKQKETKPKQISISSTGSGKTYRRKHRDQKHETKVKTHTKGSGKEPILKRCFCTLKLQKANPVKVMRVEVKHNIGATQTKGVKPKKEKPRKLAPYECEPGFCIAGQCDPYVCLERMKKRLRKEQATSAFICDQSTKCIAAKCIPTCRQQNIQCKLKHGKKHQQQTDYYPCPTKTPEQKPGVVEVSRFPHFRHAVKIGCSFSSNIEFYKKRCPPRFENKYRPEKIQKVCKEPKQVQECPFLKKHAQTGPYSKTANQECHLFCLKKHAKTGPYSNTVNKRDCDVQANSRKENKGIDAGKILKRCFCTLKLHENTPPRKRNYTVGRVAVEDRRISYLHRDEVQKVINNSLGTNTYDNHRLPPTFDSKDYSCMICNKNQRMNNVKHMANINDRMKIIFPYIPHKFNHNTSNTLITHYSKNMKIPFSDGYYYTHHSHPEGMVVKCQAPVAIKYSKKKDNKIKKAKNNKQPIVITEPEKTLFGKFKGFIRRCVQLFTKSTDKIVASKDHKTPDHIPVERKRKKIRRKKEKNSDSNVLKISKSDRHPKNTKIVSIPKTSKSLKMTKVSEKDKYNKNNLYVDPGNKKYSYFQSGDMGQNPTNHLQNKMKISQNQVKLSQNQMKRTIDNCVTQPVPLNHNNNVMCYYSQVHYNDEIMDLMNRRPPFMDNKIVQLATIKDCVAEHCDGNVCRSLKNLICPSTNLPPTVPKQKIEQVTKSVQVNKRPQKPNQKNTPTTKIQKPKNADSKKNNETCKSLSPCVCCKGERRKLIPCFEKFRKKPVETEKKAVNFNRFKSKCVDECKTSSKKAKIKVEKKRPLEPLLEMRIGSDDLKILNKIELYDRISQLDKKKLSKSGAAVYRDIETYGDLTTEQLRQIHGKSCSCCICVHRRAVEKPAKLLVGQKPCVCGSKPCARENVRIATKRYERMLAERRKKICSCGVGICVSETVKQDLKNKVISKKKAKRILKKKKLKKMNPKERKQKLEKKEQQKEDFLKRQARYKKEDDARRARQKQEDRYNEKQVKRYENTSDILLVAESVLDLTKLAVSSIVRPVQCICKSIFNPKSTLQKLKDPGRIMTNLKSVYTDTGIQSTFKRICKRLQYMRVVQVFQNKVNRSDGLVFIMHAFDKNAEGRLGKKKRKVRRREPMDFQCNLFMASLRQRPYLAIYYMCPWFYPHCMSMLGILRQFVYAMLFILAVFVWSPCILAMEICRACMCCTMCTG